VRSYEADKVHTVYNDFVDEFVEQQQHFGECVTML